MSADPRIALVRQAFADFDARNVAGVVEFLHPEIVTRVDPSLANPGTWHGLEGVAEMTRTWEEPFGGSITYEVGEVELVDGRNVLVEVHQEATGAVSGVPVELDVVFLVEFEGEQAIRLQIHADHESARAAV